MRFYSEKLRTKLNRVGNAVVGGNMAINSSLIDVAGAEKMRAIITSSSVH